MTSVRIAYTGACEFTTAWPRHLLVTLADDKRGRATGSRSRSRQARRSGFRMRW